MKTVGSIGGYLLALLVGATHAVIHKALWDFSRANQLIFWLQRTMPPETQPMAAVLIGRKAAFLVVLFVASILGNGWINLLAGALATLLGIWILGFILHRYNSPWRRIYFGFMDLYSGMASSHVAIEAITQGRMPFNQVKPLAASLKKTLPDLINGEAEMQIVRWKGEADNCEITNLLQRIYRKIHPSASDAEAIRAVDDINKQMLTPQHYPEYLLRYVIGKIIELKAGLYQTEAYWMAVMTKKIV